MKSRVRHSALLALAMSLVMGIYGVASAYAVETCEGRAETVTSNTSPIMGTAGMDVIVGTSGNDTINGLGGMDIICAGDGIDSVIGGPGADRLFGEGSGDFLLGDTFDVSGDVIGNTGADYIDAGPGDNQTVIGDNFAPNHSASSTGSSDTIKVPEGALLIVGDNRGGSSASGGGNDNITIGADPSASPTVIGGNLTSNGNASGGGSDTITGSAADDTLIGDNQVSGLGSIGDGGGNDIISGAGGDDDLVGDNVSTQGTTTGLGGKDSISGGAGDDELFGGPAFDSCDGGPDTDTNPTADCEQVTGIP